MLPPPDVRKKLGASSLIMGIDIETHDWEERSRGNQRSLGQFGFYSLCHPDDFNARVVQLGWAIGGYGGTPSVKEKIVRPEGFVISVKAAKYHGITQENATTQGCDLKGVLDEFFDDLLDVQRRGGRIVVHHLEFDCGIIARELHRVAPQRLDTWRQIAKEGLCTMDPSIGHWVRACFGQELGPQSNANTMRLSQLVTLLMPGQNPHFGSQHTAGADAHRHWSLYFALLKLAGIEVARGATVNQGQAPSAS